jgi:hypothetical protein
LLPNRSLTNGLHSHAADGARCRQHDAVVHRSVPGRHDHQHRDQGRQHVVPDPSEHRTRSPHARLDVQLGLPLRDHAERLEPRPRALGRAEDHVALRGRLGPALSGRGRNVHVRPDQSDVHAHVDPLRRHRPLLRLREDPADRSRLHRAEGGPHLPSRRSRLRSPLQVRRAARSGSARDVHGGPDASRPPKHPARSRPGQPDHPAARQPALPPKESQ